jgi:hypothetical protein
MTPTAATTQRTEYPRIPLGSAGNVTDESHWAGSPFTAHDGLVSAPQQQQPPDPPPVRIGTAEREAAYQALSTHLDAGRLDPDEYGERYAAVSVARTRPELEAHFTDLPEPHPFAAPVAAQPSWVDAARSGRPSRNPGRLAPMLLGLMPFIAVALAITTHVWLFFLLVPAAGVVFGRRGWRGSGWGGPRGRDYGRGGPGW